MGRFQGLEEVPRSRDNDTVPRDAVITGTIDYRNYFENIYRLLAYSIGIGTKSAFIDTITLTTGATTQRLYIEKKPISGGLIQNISTEAVTIITGSNQGIGGTGIILNPATALGLGGGSLPVGNVDLNWYFFVRTTSGLTLAVYYEI